MTEERLLAAYQMLEPRLHTFACRILGRRSPDVEDALQNACLLYTSPSPRDRTRSRMPSSA